MGGCNVLLYIEKFVFGHLYISDIHVTWSCYTDIQHNAHWNGTSRDMLATMV